MRHVWSVLSTTSLIDQTSNNVSLLEVLEQVTLFVDIDPPLDERIVFPLQASLTTMWWRSEMNTPESFRMRVNIVGPSGPVPETFEQQVDLIDFRRSRNTYSYRGIPYLGFGIYEFSIEVLDEGKGIWQQMASVPLEIIKQPPNVEENSEESEISAN
jgi:hypothetical protein